jgi:hypothetical protein
MLYVCCKNVILHTIAEDEALLEVLDIDATGLAAFGYAVISDTEVAKLTPSGELVWLPLDVGPRAPETAQQRAADAALAQYLSPWTQAT